MQLLDCYIYIVTKEMHGIQGFKKKFFFFILCEELTLEVCPSILDIPCIYPALCNSLDFTILGILGNVSESLNFYLFSRQNFSYTSP